MAWHEDIVECLFVQQISLVTYVPDSSLDRVVTLLEKSSWCEVVYATREEEAVGIAAGAYAAGRRASTFMQSSGLGNCIGALTSLCIPYRIPLPLFINLRGDLDEEIPVQVLMGRSVRPILDTIGIPNFAVEKADEVTTKTLGALKLCYASRSPVAICVTRLLHGGKTLGAL
jgi:sulfopyruvate decarboxylase alpha subunit